MGVLLELIILNSIGFHVTMIHSTVSVVPPPSLHYVNPRLYFSFFVYYEIREGAMLKKPCGAGGTNLLDPLV